MTIRTVLFGTLATGLALAGPAFAERGVDGQVRLLFWQAPTTLNPYLSSGDKDTNAASVVLEPLIGFDPDGAPILKLAAEVPSVENGGISDDLKTVTWRLKDGIKWSDGTPFTSADVKFTADYCMHPEVGCAQAQRYEGIANVEAPDDLTVIVQYDEPRPNPFTAFSGANAPILQKAQFGGCLGAAAATCTDENFGPIGTGAFKVTSFKTNDVATFEANPEFRDPDLPHFQTVLLKGGGDPVSAARAVLETGEFDYGWSLLLPPDVMEAMAAGGNGTFLVGFGSLVERIEINLTDPSPELPADERSTIRRPHPILGDMRVRQALSMAIDRELLAEIGYGETARPTCNFVVAPEIYASDNTSCLEQDIEGAKALLDAAGWTPGADGIREKDGMKLSLLFQTSVNSVRQDFQTLIKQWWEEIGVQTELKVVDAGVFFGGDPGSPDTYQKFYADVEMYANSLDGVDPEPYVTARTCARIPSPKTQWQGQNINRFCDPEYDALVMQLSRTPDINERAEIIKTLNDMMTKDTMSLLPLVYRGTVSAVGTSLQGVAFNPWDSMLWNISQWSRSE